MRFLKSRRKSTSERKGKKQKLFKEETSSIENAAADSETFSPVIRTWETVREQQKLHVSHSTEPEQSALPQIRTRQPQTASMPADTESVKPDASQPPLPDIKSKQKYIAAQQPTQVTPVQTNPQQAAREMIRGNAKLCQPALTNETVPAPASRNAASDKTCSRPETGATGFCKKAEDQNGPESENQGCRTCRKSAAKQSVDSSSKAGRNCHSQRAVASGYSNQSGESCKGSRKEGSCGQSWQRQKSWSRRLAQAARWLFPLLW